MSLSEEMCSFYAVQNIDECLNKWTGVAQELRDLYGSDLVNNISMYIFLIQRIFMRYKQVILMEELYTRFFSGESEL